MKKFFLLALVAVGAVAVSCGGSNSANKPTEIKVAFNLSSTNPQYKALRQFGDSFAEATGGAYKVEIFPNELLGDQRATAELVQGGVIQMAAVANPVVENFSSDFAVLSLPYLYHSLAHQERVFTSDALEPLFASLEGTGFMVVGAYTAGARSMYTNKPIQSPADLAGYKIRVMQSDTMRRMVDMMGGVGTPMAQGEVYTAIQQGVLEGAENNEMTYVDLKHYEIAPHYSSTNHMMSADLIIVNTDFFNSLSSEHQAIFRDLIKDSIVSEFIMWEEDNKVARAQAIENGATFTDVDITPFIERVQPLHQEIAGVSELTRSTYDRVAALAGE
jgi:tripartite ATP-independent transporter DctP family solute receptor